MQIKDLQLILNGNIDHISQVNAQDVALYEDEVVITPSRVKKILRCYLCGAISAEQLSQWAEFLCVRGEYCSPEIPSDLSDDEDYYEDMWDVIQSLSTPEIDGEINEKRVKQYIAELEKYADE